MNQSNSGNNSTVSGEPAQAPNSPTLGPRQVGSSAFDSPKKTVKSGLASEGNRDTLTPGPALQPQFVNNYAHATIRKKQPEPADWDNSVANGSRLLNGLWGQYDQRENGPAQNDPVFTPGGLFSDSDEIDTIRNDVLGLMMNPAEEYNNSGNQGILDYLHIYDTSNPPARTKSKSPPRPLSQSKDYSYYSMEQRRKQEFADDEHANKELWRSMDTERGAIFNHPPPASVASWQTTYNGNNSNMNTNNSNNNVPPPPPPPMHGSRSGVMNTNEAPIRSSYPADPHFIQFHNVNAAPFHPMENGPINYDDNTYSMNNKTYPQQPPQVFQPKKSATLPMEQSFSGMPIESRYTNSDKMRGASYGMQGNNSMTKSFPPGLEIASPRDSMELPTNKSGDMGQLRYNPNYDNIPTPPYGSRPLAPPMASSDPHPNARFYGNRTSFPNDPQQRSVRSSHGSLGSGMSPSNSINNVSFSTMHSSLDSLQGTQFLENSIISIASKYEGIVNPNSNRQELVESPNSKSAYRDFYRIFRSKEKDSLDAAKDYAKGMATMITPNAKWRVYLELAELAKRNNDFTEAQQLYYQVTTSQPLASQGWLEWAKMEEEYGNFNDSIKILLRGLKSCPYNEALITKTIKQLERQYKIKEIRSILGSLCSQGIDRTWKSILEGALFEERVGRTENARYAFACLMQRVPWYGPVYYEAFKLEEKVCDYQGAMEIIEKGLKELPRYGPLWFALMKLKEREDIEFEWRKWIKGERPQLHRFRDAVSEAVTSISRELIWKVHFEHSQGEERAAEISAEGKIYLDSMGLSRARDSRFSKARESLVKSLLYCPTNLRWKIWLAGCRLELSARRIQQGRILLCRAFQDVPPKSKSLVYLEASRLEEYVGNIGAARRILKYAIKEIPTDWKLLLEAVLLEARSGNINDALRLASFGVKTHPGTGRLWAVLMQLSHRVETTMSAKKLASFPKLTIDGDKRTIESMEPEAEMLPISNDEGRSPSLVKDSRAPRKAVVLFEAIKHVPKSGEVWCEAARCVLNPMNITIFDLGKAQQYLQFAIQFTPQYGDTFIEYLRLEMLTQVFIPEALKLLGMPLIPFLNTYLSLDPESDTVEIKWDESMLKSMISEVIPSQNNTSRRQMRRNALQTIEGMSEDLLSNKNLIEKLRNVLMYSLSRRCSNADPNYGSLWFHCRLRPYDTPSAVLMNAKHIIAHEMISCSRLYLRACVNYICKSITKKSTTTFASLDNQRDLDKLYLEGSIQDLRSKTMDEMNNNINNNNNSNNSNNSNNNNNSGNNMNNNNNSNNNINALRNSSENSFRNKSLIYHNSESIDEQILRERQLLQDRSRILSEVQLPDVISVVNIEGCVWIASDFTTGIINLNRTLFNKRMSMEDHRKVLFGSDQIIA